MLPFRPHPGRIRLNIFAFRGQGNRHKESAYDKDFKQETLSDREHKRLPYITFNPPKKFPFLEKLR